MFYKDERLALFIDGSNLYAAAKSLGFDIDYKLLRTEFMRRGKMLRAFYYTALLDNEEYSPIRPLVDWLNYNGFTMVTKTAKEYTDSQGRAEMNLGLSQSRATSILNELQRRRVLTSSYVANGYGEADPIADNETEEGREKNRRIEFRLLDTYQYDHPEGTNHE